MFGYTNNFHFLIDVGIAKHNITVMAVVTLVRMLDTLANGHKLSSSYCPDVSRTPLPLCVCGVCFY